jgi:hypothetical protein
MSSMGDLGRQFERMKDDPQPLHPPTPLDDLEKRLEAFLEWGRGRPDREISDRFRAEFGVTDLPDEYVDAINDGRGRDHRDALTSLAREKSA